MKIYTILHKIVSVLLLVILMSVSHMQAQVIPAPIWHTNGQKTNARTGTAVSIDRPDNVAAGDMIILIFTQTKASTNVATSGFTAPSGFTLIRTEHATGSESRPEIVAFYKIAGSSEPTTYESTATNFNRSPLWKALAVRVTGQDSEQPIASVSGANSGSSSVSTLTLPSLATTNNNSLLVNAMAVRRSISGVGVPADMTLQWLTNGTGNSDSSNNAPALFGATQVIASTGSIGTRASTWTGEAQATGLMFAINPNPVNIDLSVTKTVSKAAPYYFADDITFTITASNSNTLHNATGVKVTDLLPAGLGYISHTTSIGTYTPATGVWNIDNLSASENATLILTVKIICDESNFTNIASIAGNEPDVNNINNLASVTINPQTGGINPCPIIANDDLITGLQGQPAVFNVLSNDKGAVDPTKLTITTQPNHGTLQIGTTGQITYLPNGNFHGTDEFSYKICDSANAICDQATVAITINEDFTNPCIEATRSKTFYLPFPENAEQLRKSFGSAGSLALGNGSSSSTNRDVRSIVSFKIPYPKTIITYDHWEDGYEADITVPTQRTTQVWGDGDITNGVAPGYTDDIIPAGGHITIDQTFNYFNRNPVQIQYDGKDKVFSSNNVFISKVTGDADRFSVQVVKTDVLDVSRFGKFFRVGFGEDIEIPNGITAFRYVSLFIRAATNNTVVSLDYNGDGTVDATKTLNEGEVWFYDGTASTTGSTTNDTNKSNDIKAAATITASEPIGVDVMMGDIASYGTRNLYLLPAKFISNEYITPVHTTLSSAPVVAYFTNNTSSPVTINWKNGNSESGSISIPANGVINHSLSGNSAYHFKSTNKEPFTAVVIIDADNNGTAYDWAFPMIPVDQLTNYTGLAWAPGTDNSAANYNPIWVTAPEATTIYVKWDGNMTAIGPNLTPCGLPYDESYQINALQSLKLLDMSDNDQSGTAVFTCNTPIAAVWGQNANGASTSSPAMDVGYVMQAACLNHLIIANDDLEVTEPNEPVIVDISGNDGGFLSSINTSSINTNGLLQPEHGTVTINGNGTVTYTPHTDFVGDDYFEYSICSKEYPNTCDVALVKIMVRPCEDIAGGAGVNLVKGRVFLEQTPDDTEFNNEPFIPNVKVDLYSDKNCNGIIDGTDTLLDSTVTDASGRYRFNTVGNNYAKDDFDPTAGQYAVNKGTVNWSAAWSRTGTSATTYITSIIDATPSDPSNIALRFAGPTLTASRSLTFNGATGAAVKFSFRRQFTTLNSAKELYVRLNGTTIYTINGAENDVFYKDVVLPVTSFNTDAANTLAFVTNGNVTTNDYVFIDNIELIYFPACFTVKVGSNDSYVPSSLSTASYTYTGLGNCSAYQNIGAMATIDAIDDIKTASTDIPLIIDVLSNDKGKLNASTVTITTPPTNGTVFVNPDGTITYTSNPGYTGTDSFQYSVCSIEDPIICDAATVMLNVQCAFVPEKNVINGIVFGDIDLDGNLDIGESGISNIQVELYDASNNLLQTQSTSTLGAYQFDLDCNNTVRDEFSTQAYTNNNGTRNWKNSWTETTDTGGATGGNIQITDGKLKVAGNGNNSQLSIQRTVDLSNARTATLTFSYEKIAFSHTTNDWVEVQISTTESGTWTVLKKYNGTAAASGTESFDISGYLSENTTIRFIESNNNNFSTSEYILFDDVQVSFSVDAAKNYTVKLASSLTGYFTTSAPTHSVLFTGCGNASCSNNFGLGASDLSITKEVDNDEQFIGDNVTFTLAVTNHGPSNNSSVVAVDIPPSGYEYIADDGGGAYNHLTGNWNIGMLPVNKSDTLKITLKVLTTGDFTNTATVSGYLPDPNPSNTVASTVSPERWTDLKIETTTSTILVQEEIPFTYTITITNLGPMKATNLVIADVLDTALGNIISTTLSTGSWNASNWTIASLDSAATATLTMECMLPRHSGVRSLSKSATVSSDTYDRNLTNNTSTVTATVEEFVANYWIGGTTGKENDWTEISNWKENRIPADGVTIEFATINNNGTPAVADLHVPAGISKRIGNLINKSDKRLIIPPGSTIIVTDTVEGSETSEYAGKIVIEADDNPDDGLTPNGSFIASGACGNFDVFATVQFYAQGEKVDETIKWTDALTGSPTAGNALSSSHSWQHFGIPVESVVASPTFEKSWIQKYSEKQNGKVDGSTVNATFYDKWNFVSAYEALVGFKGYEITQNTPKIYTIAGKLNFCDKELTLTRKASAVAGATGTNVHYGLGQNIFGNSYTAAINLDNGIIFDTAGEVERTVYLYRTGSFQQWGNQEDVNPSEIDSPSKINASSYIAIPAMVGTTIWGNQIPSMQGFLLKFTDAATIYNGADAKVTLKYAGGGVESNTRPQLTQKEALSHLTITLRSNTTIDRTWLFSQEGTSDKFDNGWDGRKYFGTPTAFIYSESPFGGLQVNTSNNFDKKIITIQPNKDVAYELIIDKMHLEEYPDLHLIDLVSRKVIPLKDTRTTYSFRADHEGKAVKRFIITNSSDINLNTSNIKLVDGYLENNNELVLSNLTSAAGRAYLVDVAGKMIGNYNMESAVTRISVSLIRGVYILRLEADGINESVKLIVK